ncbi:MAG: T9SS type A sorting domain-containing protein, partial [Dysgonamonadaceae bacterium]|nr:T9SS type A sorting domain-containing protein [Dysgonamonadaceae bacterium]
TQTGTDIAARSAIRIFSERKGEVSIIASELLQEVKVVDLQGKTIATQHPERLSTTIQNLPTGIYIVRATSKSGVKVEKTVIK